MASPPKKRTHKDLVIDVGKKVRHLRRKLGLSIRTLSKRSGLSTAAIQKIKTNHMLPTITPLMKIAKSLGEKISFFVDGQLEHDNIILVKKPERKTFYSKGQRRYSPSLGKCQQRAANPIVVDCNTAPNMKVK